MEPPRGRKSEVDTILEKLNYPEAVVNVAVKSGATTREGLLKALREEVQRIKWQLGKPKKTIESWSVRRKVKSAGSHASPAADGSTRTKHRRGGSLDDLPSMFDSTRDSTSDGPSSLRQRYVLDADRRFAGTDGQGKSQDEDVTGDSQVQDCHEGEVKRRGSKTLPRPFLVRSVSAT